MSQQAERHCCVLDFYPLGITVWETKLLFYLLLLYGGAMTHVTIMSGSTKNLIAEFEKIHIPLIFE
jgi:hypothetical protein